ncbi:MAG: glycosyltransferase family 2 protein [Kiritimatiellae bacterium]|nr:glycosyltransferase family 2 protein [Kiritimatiellia bacterium]
MTDIAVIILTKNEQLHIARCLERLAPLEPRQIFVIDCFSTDETQNLAEDVSASLRLCVKIVEHEWPGLYAKQFNWALDNLPVEAKWVLRMDADEYLTLETIERLKEELPNIPQDVSGLNIELKRKFRGGEIRHGTVGIRQARIFRYGIGRCEDRAMDEHIVVSQGRIIDFVGAFYDDSLMPFEEWKEKHRGYARREAMDAVSLFRTPERLASPSPTDLKKIKYYKLPPYFRALAYFCIRYFLKLGFLDGLAGFRWHFWQGLWYRWIVDIVIERIKRGKIV